MRCVKAFSDFNSFFTTELKFTELKCRCLQYGIIP